jgi:hypothetical protein
VDIRVQLPDITEFGELTNKKKAGEEIDYCNTPTIEECLKDAEEKVQTELAFAHLPYYDHARKKYLANQYEPVMKLLDANNWTQV